MSAKGQRSKKRATANKHKTPTNASKKPNKAPWWRRPIFWLGSVASALVIAAVTAIGTGLGSTIWHTATAPRPPAGPPVRIEAVSSLQFGSYASFVLPRALILSRAQLAAMNTQTAISDAGYVRWFLRRAAVQAYEGTISLTVTSNSATDVTIKEIDIIKHCKNSLHGTLFSDFLGAGPQVTPEIAFDLDSHAGPIQDHHPSPMLR